MTSEPSHYGWPGETSQPDDESASPRGFGLFEAPPPPSVPSTFDDFPPDSDSLSSAAPSFAGFPSDDPLNGDLPSHYVPAPAVMPIPGVRHDPEPASTPSWADSMPSFDSSALDPEPASSASSWAAFAAGESPKLQAAPTEWKSPAAAPPANDSSDWHQLSPSTPPASPPPSSTPPAPPRATASARVTASVSVPGIIAPDDTPIPPELPKSQGRVYGSAAAPAPSSPAPAFDAAAAPALPPTMAPPLAPPMAPPMAPPVESPAAPVSPGQPNPSARATARATVPVARPEPGDAPPPATRSSTVYGSAVQAAASAPVAVPGQVTPPGQPGRRQHAYGDLLGPAGAGPQMVDNALQAPVDGPPVPMQRAPEAHFSQGPPMGMPPGARTGGPMAPPRGPMAPPAPADEPKPERKGRIIVGVLVICVALLAAAFGGLILVDKLFNGTTFAVGDCVKQSNSAAIKADCGESGAFKVIASVSTPEQCDDQTQPHVQQGSQILCLAPASSSGSDAIPSNAPTKAPTKAPTNGPTATPTK